ncbi:uncharacterized protein LOC103695956 [Phoenix dactylifera]|uniref:Uncharacterized protein LOC103695956 n=1 Tax=Phoenix dactylifera TaxID=42345 RepID=A0A8B7BFK9_PHODC|nr:uncharacterized protein LOC103695956 [Phoenix dactylifera]
MILLEGNTLELLVVENCVLLTCFIVLQNFLFISSTSNRRRSFMRASLIMPNFNPLCRILEDNHLSGPNFINGKGNLMIVLTVEKVVHVLKGDAPNLAQDDATGEQKPTYDKWYEANDPTRCYILASMTNVESKAGLHISK